MARDCERASMTVDVSPETAAEIAARLDAGDAKPTDATIRDHAADAVRLQLNYRVDGRPLVDAVRDRTT
jgi:hypothetical protein